MKKKFILWFMETSFYTYLLKNIIPFIRFSMYYTSLRGWKYQRGYQVLQPGHILLTLDRKKLTSLLIPGEFSHAALCVGKGQGWEVSEMTHHDYTRSTFYDLCREADRVVLLRCKDWDLDYTKRVIENCKKLIGAKYNTTFEFGIPALYCSELIYVSDDEKRAAVSIEDMAGLGRDYISPTGYWHGRNMIVDWDSDKEIPNAWEF